MKDKLLKIIKEYGLLPQLEYFQSEVWELNEAIINYQTARKSIYVQDFDTLKKHITEEIADVLVMLYQFVEYYNIDQVELCKIMDFKIDRQLNRIKGDSDE